MKTKQRVTRYGVPLLALALGVAAVRLIAANRPTDQLVTPTHPPATAPSGVTLIAGSGLVEPVSELVAIAPSSPGVIQSVAVTAGQKVKQGDTLLVLDSRAALALIAQRQAGLSAAQRRLEEALVALEERKASLQLYEAIGDPRAMTQEELLRRRFAVEAAAARVNSERAACIQAETDLQAARTQLDLLTVRSPIEGTVLKLTARAGQLAPVTPVQDPLLTLGSLDALHVRIDVDESALSRLDVGSPAIVSPRGDPDNRVKATFVRLDPLVVPKRSLTNAVNERVDTRVLQVVYRLPVDVTGYFPGQQIDAFMQVKGSR